MSSSGGFDFLVGQCGVVLVDSTLWLGHTCRSKVWNISCVYVGYFLSVNEDVEVPFYPSLKPKLPRPSNLTSSSTLTSKPGSLLASPPCQDSLLSPKQPLRS